METEPLTGALGAMVTDIDLSRSLSDDQLMELNSLFHEHLVLTFPDQTLDPESLVSLTQQMGGVGDTPYLRGMAEYPDVVPIIKEATEKSPATFGSGWHTDFTFQDHPPSRTLLYAVDTPDSGGDTLYTNLYLAYESLSEGMKSMLDGLIAIHSSVRSYGPQATMRKHFENMSIDNHEGPPPEMEHPLICTHPVTGRKALWVNPTYVVGIKDMYREESEPLLKYLNDLAVRPSFTCRVRWQPGMLTMWDNRCTQHCATADYHGQRREMLRTTVAGEKPCRG